MLKRVISVMLCLAMAVSLCGCNKLDYNKALELYEGGGYEGAKAAFDALGDYEDSAEYAAKAQLEIDHRNAIELYAAENYAEAAALFEALGDYEESDEYLKKCQDKLIAEKIVGRWEAEALDMSTLMEGLFKEELAALGFEGLDEYEFEGMSFASYYTFDEYGAVTEEGDREDIAEIWRSFGEFERELILNTTEQELIAVAEEYGISLEEVLAAVEVSSVEEYLTYSLGMSLDEFLSIFYNDEMVDALLEGSRMTGSWHVKDGVLYVIAGHEMEKGEYDMEKDLITMTEVEATGEYADMLSEDEIALIYPFTMTRADSAKPTA